MLSVENRENREEYIKRNDNPYIVLKRITVNILTHCLPFCFLNIFVCAHIYTCTHPNTYVCMFFHSSFHTGGIHRLKDE